MVGRTLGHYKVLEEIDRGGMGIVYKALDLKLNREIALKVLPPELVSHPDRKRRFVQEAQAAAALKHPNIAVIHEVDEVDGVDFIAMELIEGETLAVLAQREKLSTERVLQLVVQITDGLRIAHEAGVVHRDIKPGNILVTSEREIKIIDFGLAKLVEPVDGDVSDVATAIRARTDGGQMMGTVAYMSPEQARAQPVDPRSDIFSVGVVMYELLAGKLPFQGASAVETLNAIIKDSPPSLISDPELQRIVGRCLEKDPDDRYQTVTDLRSELRRYVRQSDGDVTVTTGAPSRRRSGIVVAVGIVAFAAVAVAALFLVPRPDASFRVPRFVNPRPITFDSGAESSPSIAGDGRLVAYATSSPMDIWVKHVEGGDAINRTASIDTADVYPSLSPDGSRIAFLSVRDQGVGTYVMPALAGAPRRVSDLGPTFHYSRAQWSRDGERLAYVVSAGERFYVEIKTLPAGEPRRVALPGRRQGRFDLSWSPDERFFAYVDAVGMAAHVSQIWLLDSETEKLVPLTDGQARDWSPSWSPDGEAVYFVSNRGGSSDLWLQRVGGEGQPVGDAVRVTSGVGMREASLSADGTKLVYSQGRQITNLWRVPILSDGVATWSDAEQLTFDQSQIECVDVSPDGTTLAFSSNRGGHHNIWTMPASGGAMAQLTFERMPDWCPTYSPDGRELVLYAFRGESRDLWIVPAAGGDARQISRRAGDAMFPMWSPDGRHVAFFSNEGGKSDIWVMSIDDGTAIRLTDDLVLDEYPAWSPDGAWVYFASLRDTDATVRVWRVPSGGGAPERVTQRGGDRVRFSRDGSRIYFRGDDRVSIHEHVLEDGTERIVADFSGKPGFSSPYALATDGQYLYFGWAEHLGDIWVMDVEAP